MTDALRILTLRISRLPGIEEPFSVPECSPGLNLVHGPNASGKSSLIRAMEAVLWPTASASRDTTITATYAHGRDEWRVTLDAGALQVTRNGVAAPALTLPSPELRHRYRLSLHDLLATVDDDNEFAGAIARASAGGLDLAAAGIQLGFTDKPTRRQTERTAWDEARAALSDAQQQQRGLHAQGAQLTQHEQAAREAESARGQVGQWRAALDWHRAQHTLATARAERELLPAAVGRLDGSEADVATTLFARWTRVRTQFRDATQALHDATTRAREAFATTAPTTDDREAWRSALTALRAADDVLARARERVVETTARRDGVRRQLGDVPHTTLDQVVGTSVESLATFARREARTHAAWLLVDQDVQRLTVAREQLALGAAPGSSRDALRDAMRLLTRWLAANASARRELSDTAASHAPVSAHPGISPDTRDRYTLLALALVAVIGWLILLLQVDGWQRALAGIGVLLTLVLAWGRLRRTPAPPPVTVDARPALESELRTLGVPLPEHWQEDAVVRQLDEYARAFVLAERQDEISARGRDLESQRATLETERAALQEERERCIATWGLAPDTDAQSMPWLVERLTLWHNADLEVRAASARQDSALAAFSEALEQWQRQCQPFVNTTAERLADAESLVSTLELRYDNYQEAVRSRVDAERTLARVQEDESRVLEGWRALQEHLGESAPALALEQQDEATLEHAAHRHVAALQALLSQRERHDELSRVMSDAERDIRHAERQWSEAIVEHWRGLSAESIQHALVEAEARAAQHTELVATVATLKHQIAEASKAHDVERALAARDAATALLQEQLTQNVEAMVGHHLLAYVHEASRDVDRPQVFHRARALFAHITRGAWQLALIESNDHEASFHAVDSRTQRVVPLSELSSGTRVQLLVAVRVAFVESEERDIMLPLFLDETLGTSDDVRAGALIDAVLSLVEQGRQVFYLTAQSDEVAHWRSVLSRRAVPSCEIDVAALRRMSDPADSSAITARESLVQTRVMPADVPAVDGHTHASYGRALQVPAVRVGHTLPSDTHVWYLIESVPVLHAVLSRGVQRWGPLAFYREHGGALTVPGMSSADLSAALAESEQLALALEALCTHAAVGRGRVVDRDALQRSQAVSERQLDLVVELADACSGRAELLLDQLRAKVVSGFGPRRLEQLQAFFVAEGYLDERTPPTPDELRLRMLAAVSSHVSPARIDALLARIASVT